MVRQCAWCLCLINGAGERLSSLPQPKLYEASHGICSLCGTAWLKHVLETPNAQNVFSSEEEEYEMSALGEKAEINCSKQEEFITQFILQLQQPKSKQKQASSSVPS